MRYQNLLFSLTVAILCFLKATIGLAQDKASSKKLQGGSSFSSTDSTNIDFTETMIDGKMQAPQGFFLQGKKSQTLTQMVKLRSKWRSELRNSKAAVKTIVK
jgi:hypothetical protein